jgi:hypothetical protein
MIFSKDKKIYYLHQIPLLYHGISNHIHLERETTPDSSRPQFHLQEKCFQNSKETSQAIKMLANFTNR